MTWCPEDFFLKDSGDLDPRPLRPFSQGDVFDDVTRVQAVEDGEGNPKLMGEKCRVLMVSSTCDIYKGPDRLAPAIQVAPISSISEATKGNGWKRPWKGYMKFLPLPGLETGGEEFVADLSMISLAVPKSLKLANRVACASLDGARATKGRLMQYFTRYDLAFDVLEPPAREQWQEVTLAERWAMRGLDPERFDPWLNEPHPPNPSITRKDAMFGDVVSVEEAIDNEPLPGADDAT